MRRYFGFILTITFALGLFLSLGSVETYAQQVKKGELPGKDKKISPLLRRLPDLVVSDIALIENCKIQVTLQNIGNAGVPDSVYSGIPDKDSGVQMYKGGQPWGGIVLRLIDPSGLLKTPGASVTHVWFPEAPNLDLGLGVHSMKRGMKPCPTDWM